MRHFLLITTLIASITPAAADCTRDAAALEPRNTISDCQSALKGGLKGAERAQALIALGESYDRMGEVTPALTAYDEAIILTPNDPEPRMNKVWTYYSANDIVKADEAAAGAIAIDPRNPRALTYKARMAWRASDRATARRLLDEAVSIDATIPYTLWLRAELAKSDERSDEELRDRQALVALGPQRLRRSMLRTPGEGATSFERTARIQLATLLLALGRPADARVAIDPWLAKVDDPGARRMRMAANGELKDFKAVIADADLMLAANAADVWARGAKASTELALNAPKDAVRTIEAAPGKPKDALLHLLARAHAMAGSVDAATAALTALYAQSDTTGRARVAADLASRGYLRERGLPAPQSQPMQDAMRACVIDRRCLIGELL